jgi:DNA primase
LGTSLTREHVRLVQGLIGERGRAYLVFDSDEAGIKAARRSVALFEKGFVDARILVLPPGQDPDSFVFAHGQDKLRALAAQAKGLMAFLIDSAVERHGMSMEGRIRVLDEMAASLSAVSDPGARSIYIKYLAETVDIDETAILEKIIQSGGRDRPSIADPGGPAQTRPAAHHQMSLQQNSGGSRIERQVVAMMLQFPEILPDIRKKRVVAYIEDPQLKVIATEITGESARGIETGIDHETKQRMMAQLSVREEKWEYKRCLDIINQLLMPRMRARAAQLDRQIRDAEKQHDHERLLQLLQERKQLTEMRQQMQPAAPRERL